MKGNIQIWRETGTYGGKKPYVKGNIQIWRETGTYGGKQPYVKENSQRWRETDTAMQAKPDKLYDTQNLKMNISTALQHFTSFV